MPSTPVVKLKDFGVSTAIFEWERDGKKSYSIALQRSYKKKDEKEYTNETINLYPEDLLKFAHILTRTYDAYNAYAYGEGKKQEVKSAPAQQQSAQSVTEDDIPF